MRGTADVPATYPRGRPVPPENYAEPTMSASARMQCSPAHTGQDDENVVLGASARAAAFPVLPAQVGLSASSSVGGRSQHALQPAFRVVRHAAEEAAG